MSREAGRAGRGAGDGFSLGRWPRVPERHLLGSGGQAGSWLNDPVKYEYLTDGAAIYDQSFEIIRRESDLSGLPDDIAKVAVRMVHAAADPKIVPDIAWTPGVVRATRRALAAGAPIFCDSRMTASGIISSRLPRGNEVICLLGDPRLSALASEIGNTKTAAAVELWLPRLDGAVVVIGNAPTALFHLLEVLDRTDARPAAVVGIPVGFVGAAESKQALIDSELGLEYLTLKGRRGGSAIADAAMNALASDDERTNEPQRGL